MLITHRPTAKAGLMSSVSVACTGTTTYRIVRSPFVDMLLRASMGFHRGW